MAYTKSQQDRIDAANKRNEAAKLAWQKWVKYWNDVFVGNKCYTDTKYDAIAGATWTVMMDKKVSLPMAQGTAIEQIVEWTRGQDAELGEWAKSLVTRVSCWGAWIGDSRMFIGVEFYYDRKTCRRSWWEDMGVGITHVCEQFVTVPMEEVVPEYADRILAVKGGARC